MALSKPPSVMGGGVIWVNVARLKPLKPSCSTENKIQISQTMPKAIAVSDRVSTTIFVVLRREK
jgi:hypothetical protein